MEEMFWETSQDTLSGSTSDGCWGGGRARREQGQQRAGGLCVTEGLPGAPEIGVQRTGLFAPRPRAAGRPSILPRGPRCLPVLPPGPEQGGHHTQDTFKADSVETAPPAQTRRHLDA